jgi:hypothetical protein
VLAEMGLEKVTPHVLANFFLRDEADCKQVFEDLNTSYLLKATAPIFHDAWQYDESRGDEQLEAAVHSVVDSTECVMENVWSGSLISKSLEYYGKTLSEKEARDIVRIVFERARKDLYHDFKEMRRVNACNIFAWAISI